MKYYCAVLLLLLNLIPSISIAQTTEISTLRVLAVGDRATTFSQFLLEHGIDSEAMKRSDTVRDASREFDVVLLDWQQDENTRSVLKAGRMPFGNRNEWDKPTILIGSAGLYAGAIWQARGGEGCTCLEPIAYALKEHQLVKGPHSIDVGQTVQIETPEDFQSEIGTPFIDVLPLTDKPRNELPRGWCTYTTHFEFQPEIEVICGGINRKTPTAAAIWRQGNLLHFGFNLSPTEMNENGQKLLLNSIHYISKFSDDRPIGIVPSPFNSISTRPRSSLSAWLKRSDYRNRIRETLAAESVNDALEKFDTFDEKISWADKNTKYLYCNPEDGKLDLDYDLLALKTAFDGNNFFDLVLERLESTDDQEFQLGRRLLTRYVPCGPDSDDPATWKEWVDSNRPYLFASDFGIYRWYVDPLAKKRGRPTADLRGVQRAGK